MLARLTASQLGSGILTQCQLFAWWRRTSPPAIRQQRGQPRPLHRPRRNQFQLAGVYMSTGRPHLALPLLESLADAAPGGIRYQRNLAKRLPAQAEAAYSTALRLDPASPDTLASIHNLRRQPESAADLALRYEPAAAQL